MKINKLILRNFLNHRETALELGHVNIFSGENGTGKSAIREAVLFALTGITRRNIINFGSKSGEVEMQNGNWQILRKETASGGKTLAVSNGQGAIGGNNTEIQEKFQNAIGLSIAQVDAMLNTGRFLEMEETERRKVIFQALGIEITHKTLNEWLSRQDGETDWMKITGVLLEDGFEFDADNQKVFVERRRAAKRELGDLQERMRRFANLPAPDVKKREEAEALLADLEAKLKALYEQRGQQRAAVQLKVEFEAVKAELCKPDNSDVIRSLEVDIEKLENNLTAARADKELLVAEKAGLEAGIKAMQNFQALGDTCDRCGQPVSKEVAGKLAAEHKKKLAEAEKQLKKVSGKLVEVGGCIQSYQEGLREYNSRIAELRKTHYQGDRKGLEKRHDELQKLLNDNSAPVNLEEEIRALESRVNKGREVITNFKAAENADRERAELEEKIALAGQHIQQFDLLEKAYSPKGVKAELLREKINEFQAAANEMLQAVNLGKLEIITERNGKEVFEVMVNGMPESSYSRAQRWAISIALQGALTAGRLGILCLDDIDMFVGQMKSLANKMIIANKNKFDTVMIFRATDQRPTSNGAEINQFWLTGRGVEVVG